MQFFSLSHRDVLAEGDGHILSSTELRGLGLVLKYDRVGQRQSYPTSLDLIPSIAQDKLRCGIITESLKPGALKRWGTRKDLRLIGSDCQPSLLLQHMVCISEGCRTVLSAFQTSPQSVARRFSRSINDWVSVSE